MTNEQNVEVDNPYPAWRQARCVHCAAGVPMSFRLGWHHPYAPSGELWTPDRELQPCTAPTAEEYIIELEFEIAIARANEERVRNAALKEYASFRQQIASPNASLEYVTAEKHGAQADAEREKNRADTLAMKLAESEYEMELVRRVIDEVAGGMERKGRSLHNWLVNALRPFIQNASLMPPLKAKLASAEADSAMLDWLNEQVTDALYLDDGRTIDILGTDIRAAIQNAMEGK